MLTYRFTYELAIDVVGMFPNECLRASITYQAQKKEGRRILAEDIMRRVQHHSEVVDQETMLQALKDLQIDT